MSVPFPASHLLPMAEPPAVRLDVRLGSGRLTSFNIEQSEFLIGGSAGCDLRIPGSAVPALIGTILRQTDQLLLQRADPAFPILLNGRMISPNGAQPLRHGDRLAIGSADATVVVGSHHLRPSFVPIHPIEGHPKPPVPVDERTELERLRADVAEQFRELEADRVLWYNRRREIEAECEQLRAAAQLVRPDHPEQQDLDRIRQELATIRHQLFEEYQKRRDELLQMQGVVRGASESLQQREREFEARRKQREDALREAESRTPERVQAAINERLERLEQDYAEKRRHLEQELDERRLQLETENALRIPPTVQVKLTDREAELSRREMVLDEQEEQHKRDLLRLERWEARLESLQRENDQRAAEIDGRHQQLMRESRDWEEQIRLAEAEQTRLSSDTTRLATQRQEVEKLAAQLAERAAQLDAQQASLAVLRARLDRQQREATEEQQHLIDDRQRVQTAQQDIHQRLIEAENLRAELAALQQGAAQKSLVAEEQSGLLEATLAELEQQKSALHEREQRLTERENDLDQRSRELAEQTALLTARANQVLELQQRLEADRGALRHRELNLSESDSARQAFQDQLRRRAEELSARGKHLDEVTQQLHQERAELDRLRVEFTNAQSVHLAELQRFQADRQQQAADLEQQLRGLADREANFARQVARLREVGRNVAASRRELHEQRQQWEGQRQAADSLVLDRQAALQQLRQQLPDLHQQTQQMLEQLGNARERLRGHLAELHRFASTTHQELETQRVAVRLEAEQLQDRERLLEQARSEHRLALTEFRQHVLDWQSKLNEIRQSVNRSESHLASKQAEVSAAAQLAEAAAMEIAHQKEELRQERMRVTERRAEVERQLSEMREWYRRKLRDLAKTRTTIEPVSPVPFRAEDLDPVDRQLGELLLRLELVDAESLASLWQQAQTQRRTLRHVLLVSGVVTLYQLALIETGNLDALMLGRFRVIDRMSYSPSETIFRVYDPSRLTTPSRGIFLLRWLAEAEKEDPVHPDEYAQRFTILSQIGHPHLHLTLEVLTIQDRPAVLQEWLSGLPCAEWPSDISTPGIWLRLLKETASALAAIHAVDFPHGRLTSASLLLTTESGVKLLGAGEPDWLHGDAGEDQASVEKDLRALGQLGYLWMNAGQAQPKKRPVRGKGFPDSLQAVLRRLEASAETPMGDTVAGATPYTSAQELVADLTRLSQIIPCPAEAWDHLLRQVAENIDSPISPLRRSA